MPLAVMIDGRLCAGEEATVSVFDRGFLYGDSVFETIRTYSGKPFALAEHLNRLAESAGKVFIDVPVSEQQLRREISETLEAAGNSESYLRVMLTRGQGSMGLDPSLAERPLRVIIANQLVPPPPEQYRDGIEVISFKTSRPSDMTAAQGAKIGNYLVSVLAMRAARQDGALEALIVDAEGCVVEGASSNVFFVRDGTIHTPPVEAGILAGITRARVISVASALAIPVLFEKPALQTLQASEEVFISSSIRELLPVVRIDGRPVRDGVPGAVTARLHAEFRRSVGAELG